MNEWIAENWEILLTAALGVAVIFWPQLKPFADAIKRALKKDGEQDDQLMESVRSSDRLIKHFQARRDDEGERLARDAAKALFDKSPFPDPTDPSPPKKPGV